MPTTAFGVDLWWGSWESAQNVGAMLRAQEWNLESSREHGWVKLYAIRTQVDPDFTRDLCVTDRRVFGEMVIANVSLTDLDLVANQTLIGMPAQGTSIETLLDETINTGVNVFTYSSWFNCDEWPWLCVYVSNTGANPLDQYATDIASGAAGAGLVSPGLTGGGGITLAGGAVLAYDNLWNVGGTAARGPNLSRQPWVARSQRIAFRSPLGTTLRVIVLGRKPWARDA